MTTETTVKPSWLNDSVQGHIGNAMQMQLGLAELDDSLSETTKESMRLTLDRCLHDLGKRLAQEGCFVFETSRVRAVVMLANDSDQITARLEHKDEISDVEDLEIDLANARRIAGENADLWNTAVLQRDALLEAAEAVQWAGGKCPRCGSPKPDSAAYLDPDYLINTHYKKCQLGDAIAQARGQQS